MPVARGPADGARLPLPLLALLTLAAVRPAFDLAAPERPRLVPAAAVARAAEPTTLVAARAPRSAGGRHDFSSDGDYGGPDPTDAPPPPPTSSATA